MNRRGLCRPSLKISRLGDQKRVGRFSVEVWNPFIHKYQPVTSLKAGTVRVSDLANLISRMWLDRHPKRNALMDVPAAPQSDGRRWAELRINATTFRSYDTRSGDRPTWIKSIGMKQAAATICIQAGYVVENRATPGLVQSCN